MWSLLLGTGLLNLAWSWEISGDLSHQNQALPLANVYLFNDRQQYYQSTTDADGHFVFRNIPEGWYRLLTIPSSNDNALSLFYPQSTEYCEAARFEVMENRQLQMDLPSGHILSGQIFLNEEPVSYASILSNPVNSNVRIVRSAISTEDGTFEIRGLPAEQEITLSIEHENLPEQWLMDSLSGEMTYEADLAEILQPQDSFFYNIHSKEGIHIEGLVHSVSQTIANANVSIYSSSQITSTTTDAWGMYAISGLPPGDVLAWASAEGFATTYSPTDDRPLTFQPVLEEGERYSFLDIDMPLQSMINIQLLDALTEEPIVGSSVLIYNDTHTVGRGQPVNSEGIATIEGLHPGDYQVYVYAENDGYFTDYIRDVQGDPIWLHLETEEILDSTYYLESRFQLIGEAIDDEGSPVAGVQLMTIQDADFHRATTTAFGEFVIFGLMDGAVEINAAISPICPNDIGYIPSFEQPLLLSIPENESVDLLFWLDHDQDQIPTFWEEEWGLDPYQNDAALDPDNDGLSNLEEYQQNLNPLDQDNPTQTCGCSSQQSYFLPILLLLPLRRRA